MTEFAGGDTIFVWICPPSSVGVQVTFEEVIGQPASGTEGSHVTFRVRSPARAVDGVTVGAAGTVGVSLQQGRGLALVPHGSMPRECQDWCGTDTLAGHLMIAGAAAGRLEPAALVATTLQV